MSKVLIIIPAYNESKSIENVVNKVIKECKDCDYVIINDGSSDETMTICEGNGYNTIDLPLNLGLSGAFCAGMKYAFYLNYDFAIQFDGDGQHNAGDISKLIDRAKGKVNEVDIVIGSRYIHEKKPVSFRMVGSRIISACIRITTGKTIVDPTSGMRLYNKKVIGYFAKGMMNFDPEPDTIAYLLRCGLKVDEVQVSMNERMYGKSYLGLSNSLKYMFQICLSILFAQWFRRKIK